MISPDHILYHEPWRAYPHTMARVTSGGAYLDYRWLRWLSLQITPRILKGNARILLMAPPREGKSWFVSDALPTWFLDWFPDKRVIISSYGAELAADFARGIRNRAGASHLLRFNLREDSKAAYRWHTHQGGGMLAAGVGGPILGFGFNLGIIDDPIKNSREAFSPAYRDKTWEWFLTTFYNRAEPGASIIAAMQRWHSDDLIGRIIREHPDQWTIIRLPAIAKAGDPMGRKPGEPLCPERFSAEQERARMAGVGPIAAAAQFDQEPEANANDSVYSHFLDADWPQGNVADAPPENTALPLQVSMDFNINPGMHLEIGQHFTGSDLLTTIGEIHGPRMNVIQAMDELRRWVHDRGGFKWPELHVFGDATGRAEWAGTSESLWDIVKQKLRQFGWPHRIRKPKANPPIIDSIAAMNDALRDIEGNRHYVVSRKCQRLLVDLADLKTDEDGMIDKRDQSKSHASDGERYRIARVRPLRRITIGKDDLRVNV